MKKIIKLAGVRVNNDALPRVSATDEERALASIPGLFLWLQAGGRFQSAPNVLRDRAHGRAVATDAEAHQLWQLSSFTTGGRPAIEGVDANSANYRMPEGVEFDRTRWSLAFVAELPDSLAGANNALIGLPRDIQSPETSVRVSFNPKGTLFLSGASARRLEYSGTEWANKPALFVITFSVENGLALRINGVQKISAPNDRVPLDTGIFQIGVSTYLPAHPNTFAGKLGHLMAFNSDLSAVENRGYLAVLEDALLDFYGIS